MVDATLSKDFWVLRFYLSRLSGVTSYTAIVKFTAIIGIIYYALNSDKGTVQAKRDICYSKCIAKFLLNVIGFSEETAVYLSKIQIQNGYGVEFRTKQNLKQYQIPNSSERHLQLFLFWKQDPLGKSLSLQHFRLHILSKVGISLS